MFGRRWDGRHVQQRVVEVSIMGCSWVGSCKGWSLECESIWKFCAAISVHLLWGWSWYKSLEWKNCHTKWNLCHGSKKSKMWKKIYIVPLEYVWKKVAWSSCTVTWDVGGTVVRVRKKEKEGAGKTEIYHSIDIMYGYYFSLIQCFLPIDCGLS